MPRTIDVRAQKRARITASYRSHFRYNVRPGALDYIFPRNGRAHRLKSEKSGLSAGSPSPKNCPGIQFETYHKQSRPWSSRRDSALRRNGYCIPPSPGRLRRSPSNRLRGKFPARHLPRSAIVKLRTTFAAWKECELKRASFCIHLLSPSTPETVGCTKRIYRTFYGPIHSSPYSFVASSEMRAWEWNNSEKRDYYCIRLRREHLKESSKQFNISQLTSRLTEK